MYRLIYNSREILRLVCCRLRAHLAGVQGVQIGKKCLFGKNVRLDRPWLIRIGYRCTFEDDVWIKVVNDKARVEIGEYTFLGRGVEIDVSENVSIGSNVLVAPDVFITDHSHIFESTDLINNQGCQSAPVIIEDDVWLGARCTILPGVTIGRGAVVGAGSVVRNNVPPYAIAAGVPLKVIRYRDKI